MLKSFYAVCLLVEDLEKSLIFYKDLLGLKINSKDNGYIDFILGDTLLAIFQKDKAETMLSQQHMAKGGSAVYAYQVTDVYKACEDLKDKCVKIFEGPKILPWGQIVAYFKDPDDNIWEVTS